MSVTCPVCKYDSAFARLYSRTCVTVCLYESACMRACAHKCVLYRWHFYHSTLVCFLMFSFLAPAARLPFFNANAFGCCLALAPPGYSLQLMSLFQNEISGIWKKLHPFFQFCFIVWTKHWFHILTHTESIVDRGFSLKDELNDFSFVNDWRHFGD